MNQKFISVAAADYFAGIG